MKQLGKSITTRSLLRIKLLVFRDIWAKLHRCYSKRQRGNFTDETANERKKKLQLIYRKCRDKENKCRQKTAAIAVLTEDHSM